MMARHFLIIGKDGRQHQAHERPGGKAPRIKRGQRLVEVPRHTLDPECERWDEEAGEWVFDQEKRRRIDAEVELITMTRPQFYELIKRMVAEEIAALEKRLSR